MSFFLLFKLNLVCSMNNKDFSTECFKFIASFEDGVSYINHFGKTLDNPDVSFIYRNNGLVWVLENGEYAFCPNIGYWSEGSNMQWIIFKNKECFNEVIDSNEWPLMNSPNTLWEQYSKHFLDLSSNDISFFKSHLENKFQLTLYPLTMEKLELLRNKVFLPDRQFEELDALFFYILLAEYIRVRDDCKWVLLKEYGPYSSYFFPMLHKKDSKKITLRNIYDKMMITIHLNIEIERLFNSENIMWFDVDFHKTDDGFLYYQNFEHLSNNKLFKNINEVWGWD